MSAEVDPLENDLAAEYERRRRLVLGAPVDGSAAPPRTTASDGLTERTSAAALGPPLPPPPALNTSGTGRDAYIPREIRKYNIAAFLTTLLWSGPNKAWPGFLAAVPILLWKLDVIPESVVAISQLMISIWAGTKGNEWAWRYRHWDSVERFLRVQRRWAWGTVAFTVLLVVLIAAGGGSIPGSSPEPEDAVPPATDSVELVYSNPAEGFFLRYPSDWTKEEPKGTIVALKAPADGLFDDYVEGIVVVAQDVGPHMSLDRFESLLLKALKSDLTDFTDVDLLSSERVTLDEHLAYEDHFTGRFASGPSEGLSAEVLSITSLAGRRSYWIAFIAEPGEGFDSWLPTARGIIDSIAIDEDET